MASKGKQSPKPEELTSREEQLNRKNEFFMAASHQLKAPVALIQWCLQSLLERESIDSKTREMARKALTQADSMSQLITDMLHVFRLEKQKDHAQTYSLVNVNTVLQEAVVQLELEAHLKGVHLLWGPTESLPLVWASASYLREAFTNLLDNAIKYSPEKGTVTIRAQESKDGYAEVAVLDEGIGITEADQEKLFTEFFRGAAARAQAHEGTGLGLVLVKHIVEEFGGEVTVKSQVGKGATFTVRLPAGCRPGFDKKD